MWLYENNCAKQELGAITNKLLYIVDEKREKEMPKIKTLTSMQTRYKCMRNLRHYTIDFIQNSLLIVLWWVIFSSKQCENHLNFLLKFSGGARLLKSPFFYAHEYIHAWLDILEWKRNRNDVCNILCLVNRHIFINWNLMVELRQILKRPI